MQGPETDLDLLVNAALAAGEIARRHRKGTPRVWHKADDAGPVTEADLEIDAMLRDTLCAARPGYGWLSEETPDTEARLSCDRVFTVDPIDGTRAFIEGQSSFSHSLAIVENGHPVAGVVYLPMRDRLFAAALGQGASLNGEPTRSGSPPDGTPPKILATRPNQQPKHWPGGTPDVEWSYRPSLAYRMALVATDRFQGMLTFGATWEWDIAAGAIIALEAGASVTDRTGSPLRLNNPKPQVNGVIACEPGLHPYLLARHAGTAERRPA